MTGSDSESTEEPVVGNLNKYAVLPSNYTGRPKKGHLIFDACFESGKYIFFYFTYNAFLYNIHYSTIILYQLVT